MTKNRKKHKAAAEDIAGPRPGHWADPLGASKVENLHRITPTLYRSAQPRIADVAALKALGIRTIVSLRSFNDDRKVFAGSGIRLVRVPINTWSIDDAKVLRALVAIREAEKQGPVLIHCMHGADRTGVVAAAYRMAVQGWDKESARLEMLRGGYGYHTLWRNIPRYIERFDPQKMGHALAHAPAIPVVS
ncbi:dual specificity protein phosphatase family protein [Variovorax paradoxus]|uniref:dual specificity protein phosphatase family protein n=1 Tax=Variovorax paradoxus TaxID=34073 RepID=UPI0027806C1F|nr:dual specificity protein phosphatase family protein [Variovorax paradoxus]MDQ0588087.1 protein tyrosine/serine phosphatase [Variovorax paradoxus]